MRNCRIETGICKTKIGRNNLHSICRIVHIVNQGIDKIQLRFIFNLLLLILSSISESRRCIIGEIDEFVASLILFEFAFRHIQLATNDVNTILDELISLDCNLILIFVGIIIIAFEQLVQIVHRPANLRISKGNASHSCVLGSRSSREFASIHTSSSFKRNDCGIEFLIIPLGSWILLEDNDTHRSVDTAWKLLQIIIESNRFFLSCHTHFTRHMQALICLGHLQLNRSTQYCELMLRHIHYDRIALVLLYLLDTALNSIADIELQRLYNTTADVRTRQYFKLIIETITIRDESHLTQIHLTCP